MGAGVSNTGRFAARAASVCAAVAALLAVAPTGAEAVVCNASLKVGAINYDVRICGMPDFDQKRIKGVDVGAAKHDFAGLVDNGRCSCVPTSLTNILGYYSAKGLKVSPSRYAWEGRVFADQNEPGMSGATNASYDTKNYNLTESTSYNAVTRVVNLLSPKVQTTATACGVTYKSIAPTMKAMMPMLSKEVEFSYGVHSNTATAPKDIATAIAKGATVSMAYAVYPVTADKAGLVTKAGKATGGHAMTVRGIKGDSDFAFVELRNPWDDEQSQSKGKAIDRVRQSRFETTYDNLRQVKGEYEGKKETRWQLGGIARATTNGKAGLRAVPRELDRGLPAAVRVRRRQWLLHVREAAQREGCLGLGVRCFGARRRDPRLQRRAVGRRHLRGAHRRGRVRPQGSRDDRGDQPRLTQSAAPSARRPRRRSIWRPTPPAERFSRSGTSSSSASRWSPTSSAWRPT